MSFLRVPWLHAPPQSLCNVHLSNMYARIATDKYSMRSAPLKRSYFYLKIYTLWWPRGPRNHTPWFGMLRPRTDWVKNTVQAVSARTMM